MPIVADYSQTEAGGTCGMDTEDQPFEIEGVSVRVVASNDEIAQLLADYDPSDQYSPDAATSREIARVVLDALKRQSGG